MTVRQFTSLVSLGLLLVVSVSAAAQAPGGGAVGRNLADMTFGPVPGMPTCAAGAVQTGDPSQGATIILAKIAAGCVIPWHWHTPSEHLILASGVARLEMKDGAPFTLRAGGFALMPTKHVHQFTCQQACMLYVYSDGAFDIHYVNPQGTEITPADALTEVKETAAALPK
ncbi:MAG: cupin domain-containing protein [Vicinamibacteraceae bacterium]